MTVNATPEPGTMALVAAGAAGLLGLRLRPWRKPAES
ncbi:MAG: PEP-CTERM sorting domain-containing protein [Thermoguttaceae bacterium]